MVERIEKGMRRWIVGADVERFVASLSRVLREEERGRGTATEDDDELRGPWWKRRGNYADDGACGRGTRGSGSTV